MKTALRTTISLLLVLWLALTFLPARPAQAAEEDASIPPDLLLATLDATSRPPVAGSQTGGLSFTFEAGGLQAAGLDWGVALSKLGREDQVRALGAAEATQTERQTEYRRPELTEWRRATAFGLQQGFTIRSAPSGKGALTLRLSLSTDLRGRLDADKRGLSFPTEDGRTLRYDHLLAWDANGTALDAELVYAPGEIRIIVQDAGAAYPLTIDPLIYLEQKVIASDGAADDYFGDSVALNAAGDTAIVGTPWDDIGGNAHQGSAYVFARSGGVWSQQAKLTASDGAAYDLFGSSVQLNAAGDTAIVGALWDAIGANAKQGSAYVFTRSGGVWSQQAQLTASDGAAYDYFGRAVALNAAGDTAIVGASTHAVGANSEQGSAYVFTRGGGVWSQQAQLTASDGAGVYWLGHSVALNAAGDTAIVGAYGSNVGANKYQGSAYVFARSGGVWSQQAQLTASDGAASDYFGRSVALNAAGDTAIVGAYHDDVGANVVQGSAYVFAPSAGNWIQQAKLTASDGAKGDEFGGSVALNAAGDTAIVGACLDDVGANRDQGSAYVFAPSAGNWIQQAKLTASDGAAYDYFGVSVALNAAGDTAIVGAPRDDVGANADQGSAYFYQADDHAKKTVTYRSNGAQDGWVLESSETSNKGGTLNSTAKTFRLGDDAARKQYRAILSFNTASLPDNAVITKVTLKVKRQRVVGGGNPVKKFKGFIMDIRNGTFGAARLQKPDFQTRADRSTAAMKKNAKNNKWYTLDLSGLKAFVNRQGLTQGRLRFKLDDDNNKVANYLSLYSGNATKANRPQLIVEYYVP